MEVVKLVAMDSPNDIFYFKDMENCQAFIGVFKNHWCHVRWKEPEVGDFTKEMSKWDKESLGKDPVKRAEDNLSWGFCLDKHLGKDGRTPEEDAFVKMMMERV